MLYQREVRLPSCGRAITSSPSLQMDCLMISFKNFPGIEVMLAGLQFPWFFSLLNIATLFALFLSFRTSFIFQKFLQIVADGPPPLLKHQTSVVFILLRCYYTLSFYSDSFNCINFVVLMLSFMKSEPTKALSTPPLSL